MPPVACSGCGSEGVQMLFRSPLRPLEPALHRPTRPPMSPMPGTWHTPPGAAGLAGVRLAVSVAGVAADRVAWGVLAELVAWVAASAGVAIASAVAASSSTWRIQRETRRAGRRDAGRRDALRSRPEAPGEPAGSGEAGELAILRELLQFCGYDDASGARVLAAAGPAAGRPLPG